MKADTITFLTPPVPFEDSYLAVRDKEKRVLSDAQVQHLPQLPASAPHAREWQLRKITLDRFTTYLSSTKFEDALDIGCGNGWFSNALTSYVQGTVTGLDVNQEELEQGQRVFSNENLTFCYGDIFANIFPPSSFSLITLNASIQYFPDLKVLFNTLEEYLRPGGEIHVLDSPFYPEAEVAAAKRRTLDYYTALGYPEMAAYYYHHKTVEIEQLAGKPLYRPKRWQKWMGKPTSPFPWYRITR